MAAPISYAQLSNASQLTMASSAMQPAYAGGSTQAPAGAASSSGNTAAATGALFEAGMYGTPDGLTAEGLLLYLQTRMNGLDEQINGIFKKQQDIEKVRKLLSEIQNELNGLKDDESNSELQGTKDAPGAMAEYEKSINDALDALEQIDPMLARSMRDKMSANGQILFCQDGLYLTNEVNNSRELINSTMKQLESSAQMEMIRLQSLMSTRGTAMQLTTNMVSAVNEPLKNIAGNVGR